MARDPASIKVWTKNTGTLIARVFEVNTDAFYRRYQREINTDIDLDGLVANEEQVYTSEDPLPQSPAHPEFRASAAAASTSSNSSETAKAAAQSSARAP